MIEAPRGTTSSPYVLASGTPVQATTPGDTHPHAAVNAKTDKDPDLGTSTSDTWAAEAAAANRRGTQRLLEVRIADPDDDTRNALDLHEGEQVVERSRLMLLDDVPVEIAQSFYPASIAADSALAAPGRIRGGAVAALAALGHAAEQVLEQVTARGPDAYEIGNLNVGATEPILVLTRISYDASGRPVEYAVNRMVAARSAPLTYRLRVTPA